MERLPRLTYLGVLLLAGSVILLQVALTRVFAIMLWHHLTYMVVSIALLGFGASGSLLTAGKRDEDAAAPFGRLAGYSLAYGLSIMLALLLMQGIEVDSLRLWEDKSNLLRLFALYAVAALPFLLAGMALGTALTCFVAQVNKLYFVDLLGSGIGGAASVWILAELGGPATIPVAATVALVSACLFGFATGPKLRNAGLGGMVLGVLVFLLYTGLGRGLGLPHLHWYPPFAAGKAGFAGEDPESFDRIYSATAEVEIGPEHLSHAEHGGNVGKQAARLLEVRGVGQDGTAPTLLVKNAGELVKTDWINKMQTASALVSYKARGGVDPDVLVIGVGGGMDVVVALSSGAKSVTAAEINTAMVEMVTERYDAYLGGLFRPGAHPYSDKIRLVNAEGRSFVRTSEQKYDIIQMSGVDSFTALSTGAYTLSEAYLYTTEAVQEFYAKLEEGGIINYSRFILSHPDPPRETLRLANIACEALHQLGVARPQSHLVVFQGHNWASTMIKKGPFTEAEVAALHRYASDQEFLGLLYDPLRAPGATPKADVAFLDKSAEVPSFVAKQGPPLMGPATESLLPQLQPIFAAGFQLILEGRLEEVRQRAADIAGLFPEGQQEQAKAGAEQIFFQLYQICVASAQENFTATAKVFHGLLDGDRAARKAFADAYPYDISPCTDDKPFFFNYYRYGQIWEALANPEESNQDIGSFTPKMPVGHIVLFASLLQITVLAAILIFLPLLRLRAKGEKVQGVWREFAYFAALGMGFMFVEIVLMQKMVIFLGHPIYAVSVVLTSLLCFAGFGSLLAGRRASLDQRGLMRLCWGIVALVVLLCLAMNYLLPHLLGFSLEIRIAAVALMIAPIGLLLGMPFPTGMRIVEQGNPALLPWCWAINGFLSVFSSVFCIVLSMMLGFSVVLLAAGLIYLLGFLALRPRLPVG